MPSGFVSTLATVMSQTSLTLPTPFPVSSASLDRPTTSNDSVSRTTSNSSNASTTSSKSTKSSIFKKLKEHKDVWWTSSAADRMEYNRQYRERPQVVHEWNYMYL